ncbi:MAG TPA: FAD-dependent oxidoreductase [Gemmataceae bacterium]|jgi:2-polyprenyl-6-methoxyphenol hydroxylase-like FAD-dependent oxidoreductase|nr:FAD-dependent oxidoreductase [Gemmataceae bacterium]
MPAATLNSAEEIHDVQHTTCCVVGGGPGGMMLALLLARRGVSVTLLEAHPTFERDFRGDTIHTGILEILDEIGLAECLHELPHVKVYGPTLFFGQDSDLLFDLRDLLRSRFPYLMWMPQERFLDFLAGEAKKFPSFHLVMGANVQRLVEEGGKVCGVRYRSADGWHEVRALLTVGADGRFSRVRKLGGFRAKTTSSPIELLWFRLPRSPGEPPGTGVVSPRFGKGKILIMIDRADHWQVGYFLPVGHYQELHAAGVEAMRRNILELEPRFAENVKSLTDWHQFSLLSVASSRCPRWYKAGVLLIGDAAHTMTPAAGAGIKYAIEDAVVAANLLAKPLLAGHVRIQDLAAVQRKREWPTRVIQALGAFGLHQIGRMLLRHGSPQPFLRYARWILRIPFVAKTLAYVLMFGIWRVHVEG